MFHRTATTTCLPTRCAVIFDTDKRNIPDVKNIIEDAKQAIRLKSVSKNGNEELANFFLTLLQSSGVKTSIQQVTHSNEACSKRQFNVLAILGDFLVDRKTRKGVLFTNAIDTPEPGIESSWRSMEGKPFAAQVMGDRFYGLGSASGKVDFLAKIYAAMRFKDKKFRQPLYLLGTCGNELGQLGLRYAINSVTINPIKALVGAPTQMKSLSAHKSLTSFKVQFLFQGSEKDARGFNRRVEVQSRGLAMSSATPKPEKNALNSLLKLISKAEEAGFEIKFRSISAGAYSHQTPDSAKVEIYLTSHQFEDFKRFFKDYNSRYQMGEEGFKIELGGLGDLGISFLPDDIYKCFNEIMDLIRVMGTEMEANWDESFAIPTPTFAINTISTELNQLNLKFDLRLHPKQDRAAISKETIARLKQVAMNYPTINVRVAEEYFTSGLTQQALTPWSGLCKEFLEDKSDATSSMVTGGGFLIEKGIDTVVLGPGVGEGNVGSADEYIELGELERAIKYYEKIIERECL